MKISYTNDAFESLANLVNFIEAHNTKGAGLRWLFKFEQQLKIKLSFPEIIGMCHNETFRNFELKCIYIKDWLIAFSVKGDAILIEAILHKSRIKD